MYHWIVFVCIFFTSLAHSRTQLENASEVRQSLGLDSYLASEEIRNNLSRLKIAIIDNGFEGITESQSIPSERFELVEFFPKQMIEKFQINPEFPGNNFLPERHGASLAQIVWSLLGSEENGPKLYLLNGNGFTNFRRAVRYAIEQKVDVILYAQNWELGGNFDGKGFINAIVSQATKENILWVNSSGNYGGQVYYNTVSLWSAGVNISPSEFACSNVYD